jgi:DUF4097 and DUF4098 domain-containing protein YvlB
MKMWLRLLLPVVLLAGVAQDATAQRKLNERRAVVPAGFIRIFVPDGEVRVFGWDKDSLVVTGGVQEPDQRFAVEITKQGARVGFLGESTQKQGPAVVSVYVPRRSQLWVKTNTANIIATSLQGALDLFSVTGAIHVSGSPREIYAETMAGEVNLSNVKSTAVRVKTASGVIKSSGDVSDLTAVSVSGDINAAMQSFGRARFESVEGNIRYYGSITPNAVMDVSNHAGSITLVIPPTTSADFAFNLYEAELTDEFGIKKRWMMSNKFKAKEMTFGVGGRPTARVTIRSFKGQVAIRRQDEAVK